MIIFNASLSVVYQFGWNIGFKRESVSAFVIGERHDMLRQSGILQPVAPAALREEVAGMPDVGFDLLADAPSIGIDDAAAQY